MGGMFNRYDDSDRPEGDDFERPRMLRWHLGRLAPRGHDLSVPTESVWDRFLNIMHRADHTDRKQRPKFREGHDHPVSGYIDATDD